MRTAQLPKDTSATPAYGNQAEAWEDGDSLTIPRSSNWRTLSDCHSAEHLLLGTHRLDSPSGEIPVCLTCKFQRAA